MGFAVTSYPNTTPLVGLFSSQVKSQKDLLAVNSGQTTLGIQTYRYNQILEPCRAIDQIVVGHLDNINSDKSTIVSTADGDNFYDHEQYYASSAAAQAATETLFNGVISIYETCTNLIFTAASVKTTPSFSVGTAVSSASGGTGIVVIERTPSVGVGFSVILRNVNGSFGVGATVYVGNPGVAFTDLGSSNFVGSAEIYDDIVIQSYYENLEPPDVSVDNCFIPSTTIILTNANRGQGVANTFYQNSLEGGSIVHSTTANNSKGRVFTFDVTSGSSEKSTIDSEIATITSSRTSLTTPNNSSSTLKGYKKGYSVNQWTLQKTSNSNQQISDLESAISILEDTQYGGPY